jgi:hypothetical protein
MLQFDKNSSTSVNLAAKFGRARGLTGSAGIPLATMRDADSNAKRNMNRHLDTALLHHSSSAGVTSRSRGAFGVRALLIDRALESRGRGECRALAAPMARLRKKCRRQEPQVQPRHPGIPRAMVGRLIRTLPGDRAVLPPSRTDHHHRRLASASGGQDHTISPAHRPRSSAWTSHAAIQCAHRIPHPTFRDDREAPLMARRDEIREHHFLEKRNRNIFRWRAGQG